MLRPPISELFGRDEQNLPSFSLVEQASDPTEHSSRSENVRLR
jgi:hypothetical protein